MTRTVKWVFITVMMLAVLLTAIFVPWGSRTGGKRGGNLAIAQAAYPEYQKYSANMEHWGDWYENKKSQYESAKVYNELLDPFIHAAVPELLTGAGEENRICSPLNVYMALSVLAEISEGNSREQVLDLLGCGTIEDVRTRAKALWTANYQDDGTVTSLLANSLWLNEDIEFVQETMDLLAEEYYASSFAGKMGSAEFDRMLQEWINDNTGGLLAEQAAGLSMPPDTLLALASTIYYRGRWDHEFNPEFTEPDVFHAPAGDQTVDFMRQTMEDTYYWGEHFSAVSKRLENSGEMWFFLPDEGVSPDELLATGEITEFLESTRPREDGRWRWENNKHLIIHLSMPKFDVVSDLDLIGHLKALGVTDVFEPDTADFSAIVSPALLPYIEKATHAARVKIDEEGVEAAAYVEMMMAAGAAAPPDEEIDFVLDRPFLFAVTGEDYLPLFMGIVNQP